MSGAHFTQLGQGSPAQRIIVLVYGKPKIGKTTLLYKLAEGGSYIYLISTDRGTLAGTLQPARLSKRVSVLYPGSGTSYLKDLRSGIQEACERCKALASRVDSQKIWVAVDTVTHMQSQLMMEARTINIKNPSTNAPRDEFLRDIVTQVDYGINLTMMTEISEAIRQVPCNICYIALEKQERDRLDRPVAVAALSGQSGERYKGDADIIMRMTLASDGKRILQCTPEHGYEVGGRTDRLDPIEAPDLEAIRAKVFAKAND